MRTDRWTAIPLLCLLACQAPESREEVTADDDLGPGYDDPVWTSGDDGKEDTSASGLVRQIDWDAFVYVPKGADDATVQTAIRRQVKSALGALLHKPKLSLRDRDARSNLDVSSFKRETLQIIAADASDAGLLDRVTYHYRDRALVPRTFKSADLKFTALFGDYIAGADALKAPCADDQTVDADSLWFHYDPTRAACKTAIDQETSKINAATGALPAGIAEVATLDASRRFLPIRATLTPVVPPPKTDPERDQLFGFGTDRGKIVVYSFFGVDQDDQDSHDWGLVEDLRFVRTLRAAYPGLAVVETHPDVFLLDLKVDGQAVTGATYEDLANWIIEGKGWPAVAQTTSQRADLLSQVREKFREHWIVWQLPMKATRGAESRDVTLEIRTYWGREDGRPDWREAARNRYLEAFWHADVFTYTGHSHFGHGPLEPVDYNGGNFPDRYQIMLFNSCVSYNYYDVDFLEMHPGGAAKLDVVANGLPAYWPGMGEATARLLLGLVGEQDRAWIDVLEAMRVTVSGLPARYEPMRAVTGEEANAFTPANGSGISARAK